MSGIFKTTKRRVLINNIVRDVETVTAVLDTDLYYADLAAIGAAFTPAVLTSEYSRLPTLVKNETIFSLVASSRSTGYLFPLNADTKTLDIMSFTRGSNATVEAGGLFSSNSPDIARVETNAGGSIKGYLFEPASTNLLADSGIVDGLTSFQTKSTVGLTPVDTGWNMGTMLAKGMKFDLAAQIAYGYKAYPFTVGTSYVFSFYVKLSDSSLPTKTDFRINVQGDSLFLDHSSVSIESKGNGVYLISAPFIGKATALYVGIAKYTGDTAKSVVATGFQVEEGYLKTSYIPTTTAAATRLADKLVGSRPISVFPFNSWYIESDKFTGWFGNGVNGLKIVGRNYIKNSALFYPLSSNNTATFAQTAGVENGVRWVGGTEKATGKFALSTYSVAAYGPEVTENLVNATDIVASIDIMATANITVRFGTKIVTMVAGVWQRVFDTGLTIDRVPSLYAISNPEAPVDTRVYYKNYKLERGTVATAWSQAPEDSIKIDVNGNLEVSSDSPITIRSLSLVARKLKQEEV